MGAGHYSDSDYTSRQSYRRANDIDDFDYSKNNSTIHPSLDPKRIRSKPLQTLESRDNPDHPESNAVVLTFDVTGSNINNARVVQQKLPLLMGLLGKYLPDPQVAVAANDDILVEGERSIQISEFESDIRIDESIRNILLTGNGGGNDGESYELLLYGLARHTVLDCFEKRRRKGYLFLYADEPMRLQVRRQDVRAIYGDTIEADISLATIIRELQIKYHVFVMWPANSTYRHAYEQYKTLFGSDRVFVLENPKTICEFVGTVIGMNESKINKKTAVRDLVAAGVEHHRAEALVGSFLPDNRALPASSVAGD